MVILFFLGVMSWIIIESFIDRVRNVNLQKLEYLQKQITEENVGSFRLNREFRYNAFRTARVNVYAEELYFKNEDYNRVVKSYERKINYLKKGRIIYFTLIILLLITALFNLL